VIVRNFSGWNGVESSVLNTPVKPGIFILLLYLSGLFGLTGCTTTAKSRAEQRDAFLAGQNAALRDQLASKSACVTVLGPVQTAQVPWVAGLTLAQAVATAQYIDTHEPTKLVLTRNGESASIDVKVLLDGPDIPLEIGDVIDIEP
jgi:hypothetical protein